MTEVKPPRLSAAQVGCLLSYLAGESLHNAHASTRWALMDKGLLPRRRTDVQAPTLRAAIDAMRPHLTADELARAEDRYAAWVAREADEAREATELRGWLTRHGGFEADILAARGRRVLQSWKNHCLRFAGRVDKEADERHAAAVVCCAADQVEAPPPPDHMISGIQARHPGALRWAGIIFGPQVGFERDWKHQYEIEVLDLRDDYVAMQKRALAAEQRAEVAEAALAEMRHRHDAVLEVAANIPKSTAPEGAAERLSRVQPGGLIWHEGRDQIAVVRGVCHGAGGEVEGFSIQARGTATFVRLVQNWAAEGWDAWPMSGTRQEKPR